jgi:hypothetical protein
MPFRRRLFAREVFYFRDGGAAGDRKTRLGTHIAPTDVPPNGCEKCVSQLRGYWFVHGYHHPLCEGYYT